MNRYNRQMTNRLVEETSNDLIEGFYNSKKNRAVALEQKWRKKRDREEYDDHDYES